MELKPWNRQKRFPRFFYYLAKSVLEVLNVFNAQKQPDFIFKVFKLHQESYYILKLLKAYQQRNCILKVFTGILQPIQRSVQYIGIYMFSDILHILLLLDLLTQYKYGLHFLELNMTNI